MNSEPKIIIGLLNRHLYTNNSSYCVVSYILRMFNWQNWKRPNNQDIDYIEKKLLRFSTQFILL